MAATVLLCRVDGHFGGVDRHILTLARQLDPARYRPVVVSIAHRGELLRLAHQNGLETDFIPMRSRLDVAGAAGRLGEIARRTNAGLLHTFGIRSNTLAARARRFLPLPWIVRLPNNNRFDYDNPVRGWLSHWHNNRLIRQADALQVISPQLAAYVRSWSHPPRRLYTITNGIDLDVFDRERAGRSVRDHYGIPPDAPVIGSVGRLVPVKGYDRLITAFARVSRRHPNARLMLVGDGPVRSDLNRLIDREGVASTTILTGHIEDVRPYLFAFTLFACSSHSEGVPIAMLEAMAMELPVASPRVGGIESVIEDGRQGRLVESNDVDLLANLLQDMLCNAETMQKMGQAARRRIAESFSVSEMAGRVQAMYGQVLEHVRSEGSLKC